MKRTIITMLLAATASSWAAPAQMTLRDCLLYARRNAPANRISRLEAEDARMARRIAVADILPFAELHAGAAMSFGRSIDPETNTYDNKRTLASDFGLSVSLPLFDGLVGINNIRRAQMAALRMQSSARAREDEISIAVVQSFYNAIYCRAMVEQSRENLRRDSLTLAATRRGVETGTRSPADLADMEALVAADRYELVNQQNLLAKACLKIKADIGMEAADSLPEPVETAAPPRDGVCAEGFVLPDVEEAERAARESLYGLRAARGAFSPRLVFNAGVSTSYYRMNGSGSRTPGFARQWHDNMGQYLGVSMSIPIFTGMSATNRLKRARIAHDESSERLRMARMEAQRAHSEALLDCHAAEEELEAARRRLHAEEKAFAATRRRYELGAASAIDLYTSSAKLSAAGAVAEGKRIQLIINNILLAYYNGRPFID